MIPLGRPDVEYILRQYGVGQYTSHKEILPSTMNRNWIVCAGEESFILREPHPQRIIDDLRFEHLFLHHLQKVGFPYAVPAPLITASKSTMVLHKNTLYWLYPFLEGDHPRMHTIKDYEEVGRMMGLFHKSSASFSESRWEGFDRQNLIDGFSMAIDRIKYDPRPSSEEDYLQQHAGIVKRMLIENAKEGYEHLEGIVQHGDIAEKNVLFEDGKLTALLDFDLSSTKPCIYDFATFVRRTCWAPGKVLLKEAQWTLAAYREVHPFKQDVLDYLPTMLIDIQLHCMLVHYERRSEDSFCLEHMMNAFNSACWIKEHKENIRTLLK